MSLEAFVELHDLAKRHGPLHLEQRRGHRVGSRKGCVLFSEQIAEPVPVLAVLDALDPVDGGAQLFPA